jgi:hypothetical protein
MIRDEELFAMSAVIGQALQASAPSPHEAMAILVIAMGRLLGREGFADIARDEAFASVLNDDTNSSGASTRNAGKDTAESRARKTSHDRSRQDTPSKLRSDGQTDSPLER